jgi:hypothetical protein
MAGLTSWLHAQGLYAGIYTDAGASGCSGQGVGSYGHYQQDANQFANWGFDTIKVDFCGAGQKWLDQPPNDPRTLYAQFSQAVAAAPRSMILNICNFWTPGQINGTAPSYADSSWDTFSWAPGVAQSWRTDTDIGYKGNIQFQWVLRNLDRNSTPYPNIQNAAGPPGSSGIGRGHWNDPDYLGPGLGMTSTQAQSQISMWAMVAAPLILGSDPRSLSSTSINMLKNSRVIAIDQDSLGAQGWLVSQTSTGQQVWVKPLAGGARALALFNRGSNAQQITTPHGRRPTKCQSLRAPERLDEPNLNVKREDQRVRVTGRRRPLPRHAGLGLLRAAPRTCTSLTHRPRVIVLTRSAESRRARSRSRWLTAVAHGHQALRTAPCTPAARCSAGHHDPPEPSRARGSHPGLTGMRCPHRVPDRLASELVAGGE